MLLWIGMAATAPHVSSPAQAPTARAFVYDCQAGTNAKIVHGQDIGPAKAEDQQHFDRPAPDTLDLCKPVYDFVV